MHKNLIAVKSCAQDQSQGFNEVIRETWRKDIFDEALVYFFFGRTRNILKPDEVELNCDDGYYSLPQKTLAILRWSLEHGYDFTFLCDTDTFVNPQKLFACGFENYDLTGYIGGNTAGIYFTWPSGGAGYWLSRKAAQLIVDAPAYPDWAEDRMVGQILGPAIKAGTITECHHTGFHVEGGITLHYCARGAQRDFDPAWMYQQYKRHGGKR